MKLFVFVVLLALVYVASAKKNNNPSYYTATRDLRKCSSPLCGGYFIKQLGSSSSSQAKYVSALDFSRSNISESGQYPSSIITDAPLDQIILYGYIGPKDSQFEVSEFIVVSAYRSTLNLSGNVSNNKKKGAYYSVQQLLTVSECKNHGGACFSANSLSSNIALNFNKLKISTGFFRDTVWLNYIATTGSISYGSFSGDTLKIVDIFVQIPQPSCPLPPIPFCGDGQVATFTRLPDRCLQFGSCQTPGICPLFIPFCGDGYQLVSVPQVDSRCNAFYCDPAYLPEFFNTGPNSSN